MAPCGVHLEEKGRGKLRCGQPGPSTFPQAMWQRQDPSRDRRRKPRFAPLNTTGPYLNFSQVGFGDGGLYRCRTSPFNSTFFYYQLLVRPVPVAFILFNATVSHRPLRSAFVLCCEVPAWTRYNVSWEIQGSFGDKPVYSTTPNAPRCLLLQAQGDCNRLQAKVSCQAALYNRRVQAPYILFNLFWHHGAPCVKPGGHWNDINFDFAPPRPLWKICHVAKNDTLCPVPYGGAASLFWMWDSGRTPWDVSYLRISPFTGKSHRLVRASDRCCKLLSEATNTPPDCSRATLSLSNVSFSDGGIFLGVPVGLPPLSFILSVSPPIYVNAIPLSVGYKASVFKCAHNSTLPASAFRISWTIKGFFADAREQGDLFYVYYDCISYDTYQNYLLAHHRAYFKIRCTVSLATGGDYYSGAIYFDLPQIPRDNKYKCMLKP